MRLMKNKKKLMLTFMDVDGRKRKSTVNHFIEGIDPRVLAEHLATLPGTNFSGESKLNVAGLTQCVHASYVITRCYLLFNPPNRR